MNVMGLVFANIYDSSLGELTNRRTMASLPYGGRYRLIDFMLSNMSNAGIRHIGIITKHNYQSLMNHIGSGEEWDLELAENGLEFLTPYSMGHAGAYRGKLDAIQSANMYLGLSKEDYVIVADADVVCGIDLNEVLEAHVASGKDITVMAKVGICDGERMVDLAVKLDENGEITDMGADYCAPKDYLSSMGVFVIKRELLMQFAEDCVAHNFYRFERDFIQRCWSKQQLSVNAYVFQNTALFNESTAEFFRNNLALIDADIRASVFREDLPIYTKVRDQVPCFYDENCEIDDCIVADGCMFQGKAYHSVLFRGVKLQEGASIKNCVVMADTVIGKGAELENCILDKNVVIGDGVRLIGTPEHPVILKRGESA